MIPLSHIQQWTAHAPWPDLRQVEQDAIICRALCDLFNHPLLQQSLAFRGGTAIHKLLFSRPLRYSEDIDLVQTQPAPIGSIIDAVRTSLSWLGKCKRDQTPLTTKLVYRFLPETGGAAMKLKIEINTREHDSSHGLKTYPFSMAGDWYQAEAAVVSYEPEELFATKLRAFLQRNKSRDLFDLSEGLQQLSLDRAKLVACFVYVTAAAGNPISRAAAEERVLGKLARSLTEDIAPLLPAEVSFPETKALAAVGQIWAELLPLLPGEPWKSSASVIEQIRTERISSFLEGIVP